MDNEETIFTMDDFCHFTGLSKNYAYKLTSKGIIPCYKPGGKIIYLLKVDAVKYMLSKKKVVPTDAEIEAETHKYLSKPGTKKK